MFKPYTKINNKYVKIMWDYEPLTQMNAKGEEIETPFAKWQTHLFKYIPNLSEIKDKEEKRYWRRLKSVNAIPDIYKSSKDIYRELKRTWFITQ
mgnify:CR=1 FL=1